MKPEFRRVKEIFLAAVEKPDAAAREAYVQEACGLDEGLLRQVGALLERHAVAGSFLEPSDASLAETVDEQSARERPGAVVGAYKLLEEIGEGGFGVVYLAEQQHPVRRRVALKVIKPGMDTRHVVARFEAERQALALMDHPNIARVLDGGATEQGRPFFVMELVKGVPITQFCDEQFLTPRQRLELFVSVCTAVQHAHQKGVIHRDLKPSNVLVTLHDTTPVVKVIDFGIAKAIGQELTDKTLFTGSGQMVGTPLYMSPEQAGLSGLDTDTRSDIYSLGVLLYELLTGYTPFPRERFQGEGYDEIRRILREEEPPRPSARLAESNDTLAAASSRRRTEPAKLARQVRGELDWVVMKALDKDRNRRYESANSFALDVRRHLADEPVQACPPSAGYRFRKFVRRNKGPVVAATLVLLALSGGIVGATWGMLRATAAETLAHSRAEAEKVARQEADKASKEAIANMLIARQAVDQMLTRVAEKLADTPQMEQVRQELLEDALKFYQGFLGQQSTDPALRLEIGKALNRVGFIYTYMDQRTDAVRTLHESVAVLEALVAEYPSEPSYQAALVESCITCAKELSRDNARSQEAETVLRRALHFVEGKQPEHGGRLARLLLEIGHAQKFSGRLGEAEGTFRRSLAVFAQYSRRFPTDSEYHETQARTLEDLGDILAGTDKAEAERVFRQALDIRKKLLAEVPARQDNRFTLSWDQQRLAWLLHANGRLAEAEELSRQSILVCEKVVADFPTRLNYRSALGLWHLQFGTMLETTNRSAEAEQAYRQAWAVSTVNVIGKVEPHPIWFDRLIRIEGRLVSLLAAAGRKQDIEAHYRQALSLWEKLAAQYSGMFYYHYESMWMRTYRLLADCLMTNGRADEANDLLRQASLRLEEIVQSQRTELVPQDDKTRRNLDGLANCYAALGRHTEALRIREQILKVYQEVQHKDANGVEGWLLNQLAWFLATCPDPKFRDPKRAIRLAQQATSHTPPPNMTVGTYWRTLGVAYYRAGNWLQTLKTLEKGCELQQSIVGWDWFFQAMAHWQLGNRDEARRCYHLADYGMGMFGPIYQNEELRRFRAEAAEVLELNEK